MRSWDDALAAHGLVPAQALLVPHDFVDRRQYLHARRTLTRLLELGAVPIINENDAIATDEIRYGDNDRLAALVAHNVGAAVLVLLTDLDGLYTADPRRRRRGVARSPSVGVDDPLLSIAAGAGGSGRGSGGMASKLEAARIASWSGVRDGDRQRRPSRRARRCRRRRARSAPRFEAHAAQAAGAQAVDRLRRALAGRGDRRRRRPAGARRASDSRCCRPASSTVEGSFVEGDTVEVRRLDGSPFARGMVFVDAAQLRRVGGRQTRDLPDGVVHEVIHRDDLVVLPG